MTERDLPTLVLLCKRPAPGHGKQRLAASLGAEAACAVAQALLDCALEDLAHWPGPRVLAPDRPADGDWARRQAAATGCLVQPPGNLGERLNALDRRLRAAGHRQLIFIGSDAPALGAQHYHAVSAALQVHDAVLLAARDGGVVLLAAGRPWPDLAALPWSTPRLGAALAAACRDAGWRVGLCGESFDIDREADLAWAQRELAADPRPARRRLLACLAALGRG
ncbi:DUF2064 domain-containing protein [Pseudomonas sp. MAP12]|uniref:DUF2064 domain-containing protein n=1 Tax=Geopseudomonas aromaticivorans TaxID=2849492 RepID=A0ABS6MV21_9GAMM|nr:DUF2064 domain-containing protein [Pseudomonas aromaticivorans]MBV2132654.1 DUF2064 domain-containing protein [Pseudomonas aromaticivorans]